jgi:hypothetical protein
MIEALLELRFADSDRAKQFDCAKCPPQIQKIRRCKEDREDFNSDDGNIWPMRVSDGGQLFGFCPAKATQKHDINMLYQTLMITAETGALYESGGIVDQPAWWVDIAGWFLTRYNDLRFYSRAKSILGDGKGAKNNGNIKGQPRIPNKSK